MKLHLPIFMRKAILALMLAYGVPAVQAATLTLGAEDSLSVDYSLSGSLQDLNNGTLRLSGGTTLQLSSCGEGDGKTYTLLTGVSGLLGADGSAITLDDTNNAASLYFDTTQPGSGFWADAKLQLVDGNLQFVRHSETLKDTQTITERQYNPSAYQHYAGISFEDVSSIYSGGAIYGENITLSNNGSVSFNGNTASSGGGAIYGKTIDLSNNGSVTFIGNSISSGGAIYGYGDITISNNGCVVFEENTTSGLGGAIYGSGSTITLSNNGNMSFSGNSAYNGGVIRATSGDVILNNNNSIDCIQNTAADGAVISATNITVSENGSVIFSENIASASGGVINGDPGASISFNGNVKAHFSKNSATHGGGAIYGQRSTITLSGNDQLEFIANIVTTTKPQDMFGHGGALYQAGSTNRVTLNGNGEVLFENNSVICNMTSTAAQNDSSAAISKKSGGGALTCSVELNQNTSLLFQDNKVTSELRSESDVIGVSARAEASMQGGAIEGSAEIIGNDNVLFLGNRVSSSASSKSVYTSTYASAIAQGGAIYGGIKIESNGQVVYRANAVLTQAESSSVYDSSSSGTTAQGGAVYTTGSVIIQNNDSVLFEKNLEKSGNDYRLRGLYAEGGTLYFSAGEGNSIEFRDSVYIGSGTVNINVDYKDEEGVYHKQQGDMLFTGQYAEMHLNEMMAVTEAGRMATNAEILDSRTSEIRAMANLYGGCLRVEDGAVYKGGSITAMADSAATVRVKSATMNHGSYGVMSFKRGTSLEVAGQSSISTKELNLEQGCTLTFKVSNENVTNAVLTFSGSLNIQGAITLSLGLEETELKAGMYKLLDLGSTSVPSSWNAQNLTVESDYFEYDNLVWQGSLLYLNNDKNIGSDEPGIPDTPVIPDEPGGELPGGDEPGSNEPGGELPGGDEPGGDEPGGELPGGDEPGSDEPGGELPGGDEPGSNEPGGELPGGDKPGSDEPGGELPGGDEPGSNEPGGELPGGDEPGSNEPGGELPGGDEPGSDEPGGELPGGDEPEIPDTPVTPEKPEGNKTVRPSGNTISTSEVTSNSKLVLEGKGTLTLNGKVSPASISVNISKNLTLKGAKTGGALAGDGDLTKKGNGALTLNDGNGSWTGDTHLLAGTIKVKGTTSLGKGDIYVKGGTLHLGSKAIGNDIIQSKDATIKSGKKFTGTYTLENGELQKGSTLNIAKTATLAGGTVNGTLSGTGKTTVTGKVKLGDKGKITTKALTLGADATLTTSAKGLSSKTTTLSIGEDATLSLGGKMTVDSLKMNGGTLKTTASKPAAITVKSDMELTDAVLTTNGKVTTNKLTLNNSTMGIKGAKAQNLTVKQNLTIGSGSALTLNGKLSAGSLTIKKDGMLTMTGSKPVTLKVKGALTLNEGSSIILNYSFVQGKTYKVLTFGSYSGSKDYYSIFGVEEDDCTITNTGKALTLTVNTKWKPQPQQKAVSAAATEPVVATKSQANPVADALVQSNWGQLEASRAFVNAMANRSMAVQLGNGERAVWASAIGSSSRHDTASGHNGADTNVSGGAFGMETQVGRASLFGLALGNSWTRVSAHGFGTIEQDTTHLGLYGQTNWRSGISADWSAAYGRSESESMGSEWNQKQLQLDGRVSYNHELNANTVLSPFADVQYYASDSAAIGTTDTGSLQNLRAEIGVAASHRTGKLGVYGEIAVHQDMVRNNPTVSMEGTRSTGINPGRTGISFTIGASYELNAQWSVNASYTGEFVENANAHSANVGASYKF